MTPLDVFRATRRRPHRHPADDAYTAWFNSNSRCAMALRAWDTAPKSAREAAYHAYRAELALEEAAAAELERLHALLAIA
jgi:hypothetical protein